MNETAPGKIVVLAHRADKSPLYAPWLPRFEGRVELTGTYGVDWTPPSDTDLIVTHYHFRALEIGLLTRIYRENRIPILILADGILEYRNTWQNPAIEPDAMYQPVVGHKMACIGPSQARWVSAWGNSAKCEVVGLPRLDGYLSRDWKRREPDNEFRVLVMTARKPGFTPEQNRITMRSLRHLMEEVTREGTLPDGRSIKLIWRVTSDLPEQLGISNELLDIQGSDLADSLARVDAVIGTYSTTLLESALANRPTACLDYHNVPGYISPTWKITCRNQILDTIREMSDCDPIRLRFQNEALADALECSPSATERMVTLISRMAIEGQLCRAESRQVQFSPCILDRSNYPDIATSSRSLDKIVDKEPLPELAERLAVRHNQELHAEKNRLIVTIQQLERQVEHLNQVIAQRDDALTKRNQTVQDLHEKIEELKGRIQSIRERRRKNRPNGNSPDTPSK